jgi:hypothetical protein
MRYIKLTIILAIFFTFYSCDYFEEKEREEVRTSELEAAQKSFNKISSAHKPYLKIDGELRPTYSYRLEEMLIHSNKTSLIKGRVLDIERKGIDSYVLHVSTFDYLTYSMAFIFHTDRKTVQFIEKSKESSYYNVFLFFAKVKRIKPLYGIAAEVNDYTVYEDNLEDYYLSYNLEGVKHFIEGDIIEVMKLPSHVDIDELED